MNGRDEAKNPRGAAFRALLAQLPNKGSEAPAPFVLLRLNHSYTSKTLGSREKVS